MAKKDTTNPEVYSRTAKGHYPIASDETTAGSVVLHGYNLAASNADVDISAGMGSRESGAYAYTVSGSITTINNMNNNDAQKDLQKGQKLQTCTTASQIHLQTLS